LLQNILARTLLRLPDFREAVITGEINFDGHHVTNSAFWILLGDEATTQEEFTSTIRKVLASHLSIKFQYFHMEEEIIDFLVSDILALNEDVKSDSLPDWFPTGYFNRKRDTVAMEDADAAGSSSLVETPKRKKARTSAPSSSSPASSQSSSRPSPSQSSSSSSSSGYSPPHAPPKRKKARTVVMEDAGSSSLVETPKRKKARTSAPSSSSPASSQSSSRPSPSSSSSSSSSSSPPLAPRSSRSRTS